MSASQRKHVDTFSSFNVRDAYRKNRVLSAVLNKEKRSIDRAKRSRSVGMEREMGALDRKLDIQRQKENFDRIVYFAQNTNKKLGSRHEEAKEEKKKGVATPAATTIVAPRPPSISALITHLMGSAEAPKDTSPSRQRRVKTAPPPKKTFFNKEDDFNSLENIYAKYLIDFEKDSGFENLIYDDEVKQRFDKSASSMIDNARRKFISRKSSNQFRQFVLHSNVEVDQETKRLALNISRGFDKF